MYEQHHLGEVHNHSRVNGAQNRGEKNMTNGQKEKTMISPAEFEKLEDKDSKFNHLYYTLYYHMREVCDHEPRLKRLERFLWIVVGGLVVSGGAPWVGRLLGVL